MPDIFMGLACAFGLFLLHIPVVALMRACGNRWAKGYGCRRFDWHDGDGDEQWHDGCSVHARCSVCGKAVMQDSQGNWF